MLIDMLRNTRDLGSSGAFACAVLGVEHAVARPWIGYCHPWKIHPGFVVHEFEPERNQDRPWPVFRDSHIDTGIDISDILLFVSPFASYLPLSHPSGCRLMMSASKSKSTTRCLVGGNHRWLGDPQTMTGLIYIVFWAVVASLGWNISFRSGDFNKLSNYSFQLNLWTSLLLKNQEWIHGTERILAMCTTPRENQAICLGSHLHFEKDKLILTYYG